MLDIDNLPPSDLEQLQHEVIDQPAQAALPCNLSDFWLYRISRDLGESVGGECGVTETPVLALAPLALILKIMASNPKFSREDFSVQRLEGLVVDYRLEVCYEIVRRRTGVAISMQPATLDSIFESDCPVSL